MKIYLELFRAGVDRSQIYFSRCRHSVVDQYEMPFTPRCVFATENDGRCRRPKRATTISNGVTDRY